MLKSVGFVVTFSRYLWKIVSWARFYTVFFFSVVVVVAFWFALPSFFIPQWIPFYLHANVISQSFNRATLKCVVAAPSPPQCNACKWVPFDINVNDAFRSANCYKFRKEIRKWDFKCSFQVFNYHLHFQCEQTNIFIYTKHIFTSISHLSHL